MRVSVLYLPPYSPDFNPIEQVWSKLKQLLRGLKARLLDENRCSSALHRLHCGQAFSKHFANEAGHGTVHHCTILFIMSGWPPRTKFTICRPIGIAEVAAGDGALQTCNVRVVWRIRKSCTSVPSFMIA